MQFEEPLPAELATVLDALGARSRICPQGGLRRCGSSASGCGRRSSTSVRADGAGVADHRPLDELRERHLLEIPAGLVRHADPDLLQDAVAFAVVGVLGEGELRTFDRGDDLGERDLARRACEHVAAAHPALRAHEARALHREQDLLEVGLREAGPLGDLLDRSRPIGAVQREREQGTGCVVATRRHLSRSWLCGPHSHFSMLA